MPVWYSHFSSTSERHFRFNENPARSQKKWTPHTQKIRAEKERTIRKNIVVIGVTTWLFALGSLRSNIIILRWRWWQPASHVSLVLQFLFSSASLVADGVGRYGREWAMKDIVVVIDHQHANSCCSSLVCERTSTNQTRFHRERERERTRHSSSRASGYIESRHSRRTLFWRMRCDGWGWECFIWQLSIVDGSITRSNKSSPSFAVSVIVQRSFSIPCLSLSVSHRCWLSISFSLIPFFIGGSANLPQHDSTHTRRE